MGNSGVVLRRMLVAVVLLLWETPARIVVACAEGCCCNPGAAGAGADPIGELTRFHPALPLYVLLAEFPYGQQHQGRFQIFRDAAFETRMLLVKCF